LLTDFRLLHALAGADDQIVEEPRRGSAPARIDARVNAVVDRIMARTWRNLEHGWSLDEGANYLETCLELRVLPDRDPTRC
jgi:hypothetical protein